MPKKLSFINILIAALLALLTVVIGLLSGFAPSELPQVAMPYLRFIWPTLGVATLLFVGLTVWLTIRQSYNEHEEMTPRSKRQQRLIEKQNRQLMLERVRAFWIKGVLEHSLHRATLITLGLNVQQDAIANPWHLVIQQPDQPESPLPPGTSIIEVYNDTGGELLILGEPGSGKTTLLLELTRHLLDHAEQDDKLQMPVVFNLSSWATKQQPLAQWLVEELMTKYQVSRKLGQVWVNNDQIVPLLDGLDEVTSDARAACVDAINTYRQQHMVPTVVCSRRTEYLTQTKRVALRNAVVVQPLRVQQIDAYLSSAGSQLAAVRAVLNEDKVLQELATTPLIVNILILTYRDVPLDEITEGGSREARQEQLLASYVQHMLKRPRAETRYTPEQTIHWLSSLADQMKRHNQTEFYIERMQPDWLQESRLRWLHYGGVVGLVYGALFEMITQSKYSLIFGLVFGLVFGLIFRLFDQVETQPAQRFGRSWMSIRGNLIRLLRSGFIFGLLVGLVVGLIYGLLLGLPFGLLVEPSYELVPGLLFGLVLGVLFGLVFGLLGKLNTKTGPAQGFGQSWMSIRGNLIRLLRSGFIFGLLVGLVFWLIDQLFNSSVNGNPIYGLTDGLDTALNAGLFYALVGKLDREIQPAEVVGWSWMSIRRNLVKVLGTGLVVGSVFGMTYWIVYFNAQVSFVIGLFYGLIYILLIGLSGGLSKKMLDKHSIVSPNQGIRRSARNSVFTGLLITLLIGLVAELAWAQFGGIRYELFYALDLALLFGLVAGLRVGGVACLQHVVLRLFLWHSKSIPWNYSRFLDYAAERILLRKVGGGYIFIHRLLLDHFASLEKKES